jgi:hypothetical protein
MKLVRLFTTAPGHVSTFALTRSSAGTSKRCGHVLLHHAGEAEGPWKVSLVIVSRSGRRKPVCQKMMLFSDHGAMSGGKRVGVGGGRAGSHQKPQMSHMISVILSTLGFTAPTASGQL